MNDDHQQQLESALHNLTMQPLPSGLTARIIAEIAPSYAPEPFRLGIGDVLTAVLVTLLLVVGMLMGLDAIGITNFSLTSAEMTHFNWFTPITTVTLALASLEILIAYLASEAFDQTL